jgi:hypothetical protein
VLLFFKKILLYPAAGRMIGLSNNKMPVSAGIFIFQNASEHILHLLPHPATTLKNTPRFL